MAFFLYFTIACVICIGAVIEYDRIGHSPCDFFKYYGERPIARPLLGFINGIIRIWTFWHPHLIRDVQSWAPDLQILSLNWEIIAAEAKNLHAHYQLSNLRDISKGDFDTVDEGKGQWKVFVMKWHKGTISESAKLCPKTCALLDQVPSLRSAMFSILAPGAYIAPHSGPSKSILRYHMGLDTPTNKEQCFIRVHGEKYHWQNGEAVLLDDTYEHSVVNNTNETRVILFGDILRPMGQPLHALNYLLCTKFIQFADFIKEVNDIAEVPVQKKVVS